MLGFCPVAGVTLGSVTFVCAWLCDTLNSTRTPTPNVTASHLVFGISPPCQMHPLFCWLYVDEVLSHVTGGTHLCRRFTNHATVGSGILFFGRSISPSGLTHANRPNTYQQFKIILERL